MNSNNDFFLVFSRPIILTVAKCWDPSPQGYFTLPRSKYQTYGFWLFTPLSFEAVDLTSVSIRFLFSPCLDEPIRPIDPAAWVSHSVAMTGAYPPFPGSSSLSTITSSSSVTETERESFSMSPLLPHLLCALLFIFSSFCPPPTSNWPRFYQSIFKS